MRNREAAMRPPLSQTMPQSGRLVKPRPQSVLLAKPGRNAAPLSQTKAAKRPL